MAATDSRRFIRAAPYRVWFVLNKLSIDAVGWGGGHRRQEGSSSAIMNVVTEHTAGYLEVWISKDLADFSSIGTPVEFGGSNVQVSGTSGIGYIDLTATQTDCEYLIFLASHLDTSSSTNDRAAPDVWLPLNAELGMRGGSGQFISVSGTNDRVLELSTTNSDVQTADETYRGGIIEIVRGTGAGQFQTIISHDGTAGTVTVEHAWVIDPVAADSVYIIHPRPISSQAMLTYSGVTFGYCSGTSATADVVNGATSGLTNFVNTNSYYDECILYFTEQSGNPGQGRRIASQSGAVITLATAFDNTPQADDQFIIIPARTDP